MAWTPTNKVIDPTGIVDNLLGYIDEYAADALAWANAGEALPDFEARYPNAAGRLSTVFPSIMVLDQRHETDLTGDVLIAGLELTLETTLTGSNPDDLVLTTKKYAMAVESMLSNIAPTDLMAGALNTTNSHVFEIETRFDILRGDKTANSYLQIFQTRVVYKLETAAF